MSGSKLEECPTTRSWRSVPDSQFRQMDVAAVVATRRTEVLWPYFNGGTLRPRLPTIFDWPS